MSPIQTRSGDLVINELDYDQPGADVAEFVELKNVGAGPTDLGPLELWLVDGNGGGAVVYQAIDLPSVELMPGDFYVVCTDVATVAPCDMEALVSIQNGAPDAVALVLEGAVVDTVSYGGDTGAPYTEGSGTGLQDSGVTGQEFAGLSRFPDGADTGVNNVDLGVRCTTPGRANSAGIPPCQPPFGACGDPAVFIHDIQGNGATSPMDGATGVTIEGVVVGDFQNISAQLGGFFLQEENTEADASSFTSEGVFVHDDGFGLDVRAGDRVRVQGRVVELSGLTSVVDVSRLAACGGGAPVSATPVVLPVAQLADLERYEGMLVTFPQVLYATSTHGLGSWGEMEVSVGGRLFYPTSLRAPGDPAAALQDLNDRSRLLIDDGSTVPNPAPVPYLAPDKTLRLGDTVQGLTGVLSYGSNRYRLQPTGPVVLSRENARTVGPEVAPADLAVASLNLSNFFNGDGRGGGFPTLLGADTLAEYRRQCDKVVAAISRMEADVLALIAVENDGYGLASAIRDLVDRLNAAAPAGTTYAFVDPGVPQLGSDETAVALLYRTETVAPTGVAATTQQYPFDARNHQPLAQAFAQIATGERFTVVANHFQSREDCDGAIGLNADQGDGQGCWNPLRTAAAESLVSWLATDPVGSGDPDALIVGDLSSYAQEDPIVTLKEAGFADLIAKDVGDKAYSFVQSGQAGYPEHLLASPSLTSQVVEATIWHINADEPRVLDYNDEVQDPGEEIGSVNPAYLYSPDPYRSSEYDPMLAYLDLSSPSADLSIAKSVAPAVNVPVGGTVTYTISVQNSGNEDAEGVALTDALPAAAHFSQWLASPGNVSVDNDVITWHGDVGAGGTLLWTFTAGVSGAPGSAVTNTARIDHAGEGSEATATFSFARPPIGGLVINEIDYDQPGSDQAEFVEIKNTSRGSVDLGRCTLQMVNGAQNAVYRTITLPSVELGPDVYYVICGNGANVTECDLDTSPSTDLIQNGAPDALALRCDSLILDTVSYEGDTGAPYVEGSGMGLEDDPSQMQVGISRCPDGADSNQNNLDLALEAITPGLPNRCRAWPLLSITKTVTTVHEPVRLGEPITYSVEVVNSGGAAASSVEVSDTLPAGVAGKHLAWIGSIAAGGEVVFTLPAVVTDNVGFCGRPITNTAVLRHSSGQRSASASFSVQNAPPLPDLAITKAVETAHVPVRPGDAITYTVVVANRGAADAAGLELVDILPDGTIGSDLAWTGTLSAGRQVEFTLPARVGPDLACSGQQITNTASFHHASGSGSSSVAFTVAPACRLYLPLAIKGKMPV